MKTDIGYYVLAGVAFVIATVLSVALAIMGPALMSTPPGCDWFSGSCNPLMVMVAAVALCVIVAHVGLGILFFWHARRESREAQQSA